MKQALKDARYNYFWILIIMCVVFTICGINGLYLWIFWIVALAMIIDLFNWLWLWRRMRNDRARD